MITSSIKRLPKKTIEIEAIIETPDIKQEYEIVIKQIVADYEAPGFRKGKAPRELVEKNLDPERLASLVVRNLLPKAYAEVAKKNDLKPIIDPKAEIIEPKEKLAEILKDKNLKIRFTTCEKPEVKLNDYKNKIKGEAAKEAIWTPDKGEPDAKKPEESKETADQKKFVKVIDVLLKTAVVEMGDMVIATETNRLLSQTLDEIKKLGLSLEEYLTNTGKTADTLKREAQAKAEANLKLTLIFDEIACIENLTVEKTDIDAIIAKIPDPKQKSEAEKNSYQLAPILLRQKVVDFLMKL